MSYFRTLDIGASALTAQTLRMETISQNIANSQTTRAENGEAYRRKMVVLEERKGDFAGDLQGGINKVHDGGGVRVARIIEDESPLRRAYEPGHPDADEDGYVFYPNVNPVTEMIHLISATRAYEANVTSINSAKSLAMKALEIGR